MKQNKEIECESLRSKYSQIMNEAIRAAREKCRDAYFKRELRKQKGPQ